MSILNWYGYFLFSVVVQDLKFTGGRRKPVAELTGPYMVSKVKYSCHQDFVACIWKLKYVWEEQTITVVIHIFNHSKFNYIKKWVKNNWPEKGSVNKYFI
jgi:hypothetical protein